MRLVRADIGATFEPTRHLQLFGDADVGGLANGVVSALSALIAVNGAHFVLDDEVVERRIRVMLT
jgi:CII-binding regulator of phage lambda lysogenization HflD